MSAPKGAYNDPAVQRAISEHIRSVEQTVIIDLDTCEGWVRLELSETHLHNALQKLLAEQRRIDAWRGRRA